MRSPETRSRTRRGCGLALCLAVLALGVPAVTAAGSAEASLQAVMTGPRAELRERIPIGTHPGELPKSVLSLELPRLEHGARIVLNGEVALSETCVAWSQRCIGQSYTFDPRLRAWMVLARGPRAHSPNRALQVSGVSGLVCEQTRPNRNHHCPLDVGSTAFEVPRLRELPCRPGACRLNLLVDASNPAAGDKQFIVVGSDQVGGTVEGGKARVSAAISTGPLDVERTETDERIATELPASFDGGQRVVYSQPLDGLLPGDVLLVGSQQTSSIVEIPHFISNQVVITSSPFATDPSRLARRVISRAGTATETNGFNCTLGPSAFVSPCVRNKAGLALVEERPLDSSGQPRTLYANLVSRGFPKLAQAARGSYPPIDVLDAGYLDVTRLREAGQQP